jgi:hypothetical protein
MLLMCEFSLLCIHGPVALRWSSQTRLGVVLPLGGFEAQSTAVTETREGRECLHRVMGGETSTGPCVVGLEDSSSLSPFLQGWELGAA